MGLFERDYVMRIVQQLAELLARVLKLKAAKRYDEAAEAIEAGCPSLLGVDFAAIALVDSSSAAQLLSELSRIRMFARLLEELGDVYALEGNAAKARARDRHALEMYLEVISRKSGDSEALAGIERLRSRVDATLLTPRYWKLLG